MATRRSAVISVPMKPLHRRPLPTTQSAGRPLAVSASRRPLHHVHPMLTQWFRRWCRGARWPRLVFGADLALPVCAATVRHGPYAGRQGAPGCAALVEQREKVPAVPAGPWGDGVWREVHGRQDDGAVARWMSLGESQP
jgi:hypothetical protein